VDEPVADQPAQKLSDFPEQPLIGRSISAAFGTHCLCPQMFARLHVIVPSLTVLSSLQHAPKKEKGAHRDRG
jgi:hypothetical protein